MVDKEYTLDTEEFAALNRVKEQTVRARMARNGGTYFGIEPKKLANNRLLWPSLIVKKDGCAELPKLANLFSCPNCGCHLSAQKHSLES